jgi:hypothetical protein
MLKNKDFWIGLILGIILYYVYANHVSKGKGMGGGQ